MTQTQAPQWTQWNDLESFEERGEVISELADETFRFLQEGTDDHRLMQAVVAWCRASWSMRTATLREQLAAKRVQRLICEAAATVDAAPSSVEAA